MGAPLIAVVGTQLAPGRITGWRQGAHAVQEGYVEGVRRAGGRPVLVLGASADELDGFAGLLLTGGGDVAPARYGGDGHAAVYGVDERRDALEIGLLRAAVERRVPVLAICRGIQVLNVAYGGTLHAHLPDVGGIGPHGEPGGDASVHAIELADGSRVAAATGTTELRASCHHHQGVKRVGEGLVVTGSSGDGLVEALEVDEPGTWVVSVQWHPEDTAAADPAQQALFDALVAQARTY